MSVELKEYQQAFLDSLDSRNDKRMVVLKARKIGKTEFSRWAAEQLKRRGVKLHERNS